MTRPRRPPEGGGPQDSPAHLAVSHPFLAVVTLGGKGQASSYTHTHTHTHTHTEAEGFASLCPSGKKGQLLVPRSRGGWRSAQP